MSRVLRAYYKEQGKPLPPWLGVDPRDREKVQDKGGAGGYLGSLRRSAGGSTSPAASTANVGRGGGLGDIWGDGGTSSPAPEGSLRKTGAGAALGPGRAPARRPLGGAGNMDSSGGGLGGDRIGGARPLPSQRAGSYQNVGTAGGAPASGGGGGTAQDRLRARLAGRMGSSGSSGSGGFGSGDEGGGRRY